MGAVSYVKVPGLIGNKSSIHFFRSNSILAFFCLLDEIKTSYRLPGVLITMTDVLGGIEPRFSATMISSWCGWDAFTSMVKDIGFSERRMCDLIKLLL